MLITTTEELRLSFPSHAIDDISPLTGFLENSELDFLKGKLGDALYAALVQYYSELDIDAYLQAIQDRTEAASKPYPRLLFLCQRAIAFDAFSRAIGIQAVSLSNMGVNVATTDDYGTPTKDSINDFRATCSREAHICINLLLEHLEDICKQAAVITEKSANTTNGATQGNSGGTEDETESDEKAITAIAALWKESDFYFIASGLLIPTAKVMEKYVSFYENREKFISFLPDLHYIQDELIAPLIGEDFCDALVTIANRGTDNALLARLISRLRRCEAAYFKERTEKMDYKKEFRQRAHDEGERHIHAAVEYCELHQAELLDAAVEGVTSAPWYSTDTDSRPEPKFKNNSDGNAMFVTPAMN